MTQNTPLTEEEKQFLLRFARKIMSTFLDNQRINLQNISLTPNFKSSRGVFVSVYSSGELRGCIGSITSKKTLLEEIQTRAIDSISRDHRFPPVSSQELEKLTIEISVLTPLTPVPSYKDIDIEKHGIILKKQDNYAIFLPKVATENGWNIETTLEHLSKKAGLKPEDWKKNCSFIVFESISFKEK